MKKSPFVTPELDQMRREQTHRKAVGDLLTLHDRFLDAVENHRTAVEEVKQYAAEVVDHAERIRNLPKGEKGDSIKGDPGESPDVNAIIEAVLSRIPTPKDGKDANPDLIATRVISRIKVKDGKDAVINEDALIERLIEKLKTDKTLTQEHIGGLKEEISSYRHQMAMKQAGQHGGGDTVVAGTNITITSNPNGTKTISSGAVGTAVYNEVVAGSGTSWTLAGVPATGTLRLYANGQRLTITVDYTLAGAVITTLTSWVSGTLLADYST